MHVYRSTNSKPIHIFQFKSPLLYIWCVYVAIFFYRCFLLLMKNLKSDCFYTMLIACKCMPLYKKLDCNTKSEPPYFATNLPTIFKWYLPSKDMLKRIACVLDDSCLSTPTSIDALLSFFLDPLKGLSMLNCKKLELRGRSWFPTLKGVRGAC
jgi:hypothetical protein